MVLRIVLFVASVLAGVLAFAASKPSQIRGQRWANPFMARVMSVFMNMDRMMGAHFETGLANLKAVAEATAE